MNINKSLEENLEDVGCKCPTCWEIYDIKKDKKKPTQFSCQQHNVCIECFEKYKLKTCPVCRMPITFHVSPIPNSQMITMIETLTNVYNNLKQPNQSQSNPPSIQAQPVQILQQNQLIEIKPPNGEVKCFSLNEIAPIFPNYSDLIFGLLPTIVQKMGWENVSQELESCLEKNIENALYFIDKRTKEIKGFTIILPSKDGIELEAHWTSVLGENQFATFYNSLHSHFSKGLMNNNANDLLSPWYSCPLNMYFNIGNKIEFLNFQSIEQMLNTNQHAHSTSYIPKSWGTQALIKLYKKNPPGFPYTDMGPRGINPDYEIVENNAKANWHKKYIPEFLKDLNPLFRLCVTDEIKAKAIKQRFENNPGSFFIYKINNIASGFVEWDYDAAKDIQIYNLTTLSPESFPHLLDQFFQWVKKQNGSKKENLYFKFPQTLTLTQRNTILRFPIPINLKD